MTTITESKIKPRRAWNRGLNRIDRFLQSVYKDMTKADQKKKDTSFRRYYRYYNDGDTPRGLRYPSGFSVSKYDPEWRIEEVLERNVNEVMSYLLSKYWKKS